MKKDDGTLCELNSHTFRGKDILIHGRTQQWEDMRSHCERLSPKPQPSARLRQPGTQQALTKPTRDSSKEERRAWDRRHVAKMQDAMDACGFGKSR